MFSITRRKEMTRKIRLRRPMRLVRRRGSYKKRHFVKIKKKTEEKIQKLEELLQPNFQESHIRRGRQKRSQQSQHTSRRRCWQNPNTNLESGKARSRNCWLNIQECKIGQRICQVCESSRRSGGRIKKTRNCRRCRKRKWKRTVALLEKKKNVEEARVWQKLEAQIRRRLLEGGPATPVWSRKLQANSWTFPVYVQMQMGWPPTSTNEQQVRKNLLGNRVSNCSDEQQNLTARAAGSKSASAQ